MGVYPDDITPKVPNNPANYQYSAFEIPALTAEEMKVLRECSREGTFKRGLPFGALGGTLGYYLGSSGRFMHKTHGAKPLAIVLTFFGYFVGKISYHPTCMKRLLDMPDSSVKKLIESRRSGLQNKPTDEVFIDSGLPSDSNRSSATDIDIAGVGSFDSHSSIHADDLIEQTGTRPEDIPVRNYTSYDDLRQQNRLNYTKMPVGPAQPREPPVVRRRQNWEEQPPNDGTFGSHKTKYGDTWD